MESGSSATSWQAPPTSPSSAVRFNQTPPDSPKSCMKGSRRLNFTEPGGGENNDSSRRNQADSPLCSSSPKSPRKNPKTVMIKSPGSGVQMTPTGIIGNEDESTLSEQAEAEAAKAELQFQFHLSQHYESSPVPPNCTSNGSYEEYMRQKEEEERKHNVDERGDNENQSFTFDSSTASQRDLSQYDPQLAEIATRFVNEIIEKAKLEVVNRQKAEGKQRSFSTTLVDRGRELLRMGNGQPTHWYRRAHGTISKWVTNLCVRAQNAVKT